MIKKQYSCKIQKLDKLDKDVPINLVLSGGGVKGVAHVALLEKLEEENIKINSISGCSVGALVAIFYASGKSTQEILKLFRKTDLFQYSWFTMAKPGIFNTNKHAPFIKKHIKKTFEELEIPVTIAATNLNIGATHYFNEGNILRPLLASFAVPVVFNPVLIDGDMYSDGGILDNFPVRPFKKSQYPIIGSNIFSTSEKKNKQLNTTLKVLTHSLKLLSNASEDHKLRKTFATICFPLDKFGGHDTKEVNAIYEIAKLYIEENW